jgi:Mn2+/Fe2+ NRAMP family transporter
MTDVTGERGAEAPSTLGSRLRYVGPGIVIAVTGVGAGDMVSSLVAGLTSG